MTPSVYQFPEYYALGYRWNTEAECDFVEACLKRFGVANPARILDIGCGAGRHLFELGKRGHRVTGFDIRPEMITFVEQERRKQQAKVDVYVGDLRADPTRGQFDAAICFMDTFRYLLSNDEIIAHLQRVADRLAPGGLYLTDFWIPRQWDQIGNEIYQWEQSDGDRTVRVFYVQHPDSIDPVTQTFEDELVFSIEEDGATREIRGERTRTRLILPQEFAALVRAAGGLKLLGSFPEFDLKKPLTPASITWRMISVLQRPA